MQNIDGLGFEPSWFLKFGAINPREFRCRSCLTAGLEAGLGTGIKEDFYIASVFLATRSYGRNPYDQGLYLGAGPRVLLGYSLKSFKFLLDTQKIYSTSQDMNLSSELSIHYSFNENV